MRRTVIFFLLVQFYNTWATNENDIHLHLNFGNKVDKDMNSENELISENEVRGMNYKLSWFNISTLQLKIGRTWRNIWLTPTSNLRNRFTPCLFRGKLEGDPKAVVTVSGCPDRDTSVAIAFSLLPFGIVDLTLVDGITTNLDAKTSGESDIEASLTDDYLLPPPRVSSESANYWLGPIPSTVVLKTDVKYDNSLLEHFDNSHEKTRDWVKKVIELAKPKFSHDSLTIKVTLEVVEISHFNETLEASDEKLKHLQRSQWHRVLTSYFCKEKVRLGAIGRAYLGSACHGWGFAVNINELYSPITPDMTTARTFAHELGHNLGMRHDFDEQHGGTGFPGEGGKCDGKGLMSYGSDRPDIWSSCSDTDMLTWWKEEGHECVNTRDIVDAHIKKKKACVDEIGAQYQDGDTWTCADGCNKCDCSKGRVISTKRKCIKYCKDETGAKYKPRDSWTCADGCNKCRCVEEEESYHGQILSTRMVCSSTKGCPSGWSQRGTGCYFVKESPMNWKEAKKFCSELQADMVMIENEAERQEIYDLLRDLLKKQLRFWLGVRNIDGVWKQDGGWTKGKKFTLIDKIYGHGIGDCLQVGKYKLIKAVCRKADMPFGTTFNPFCKKSLGEKKADSVTGVGADTNYWKKHEKKLQDVFNMKKLRPESAMVNSKHLLLETEDGADEYSVINDNSNEDQKAVVKKNDYCSIDYWKRMK